MMNIAVMSDLHVGLGARGKDLCPEPPHRRTERVTSNTKIKSMTLTSKSSSTLLKRRLYLQTILSFQEISLIKRSLEKYR